MERLPADVLYEISMALAGKPVYWEDKLNNAKQIINLCKVNKRFNQLYCKNDRIWRELWLRDISTTLPKENIKNKYIAVLKNLINRYSEPLEYPSANGYDQALKHDLQIYRYYEITISNALITAAENGHLNAVKVLLDNGAWVDASGGRPLFYSVLNGHFDVVKYLVDRGADIHIGRNRVVDELKAKVETTDDPISKQIYEFLVKQ